MSAIPRREVARLATTVVALRDGSVAATGLPRKFWGDVAAMGSRGAGRSSPSVSSRITADGLSALDGAGGQDWLPPRFPCAGRGIRVRIAAQDVILSRARPEGLSAINILQRPPLPGSIPGQGPGALFRPSPWVKERLIARVTPPGRWRPWGLRQARPAMP